ncbi:MAG: ATP-binding protein [Bryobacterales bacterium]|nr:ATP-binding protein [Bryobacterales bacterium]
MVDAARFVELAGTLVHGLLRQAIGYRVEYEVPYFQGIAGYMVEAPLLWIRHSRFPIFFVAYDQHRPDVLSPVIAQLQNARASEHFALLVVIPTSDSGTGNEAQELRHLVAGSVYRCDFVVLDRHHLSSIIGSGSAQRLVEIILEQGIELSSISPYAVRGPVSDRMFFGREREIKSIAQAIRTGDYAVLGGRRIGKSSTLLKLARLLNNDPRYHAVYLNCEDKFCASELTDALARDLAGNPELVGLRDIIAAGRRAVPNKQLVLLLDEIDELLAGGDGESNVRFFKTLRSLSHEDACRFVFSGSRTLHQRLNDPQSPFFNFCDHLHLGPLEEKSVAEIVTKPMRQFGIQIDDEERFIDEVIRITSSHPCVVQWVCNRLIGRMTTRRLCLGDLNAISADPEYLREYVTTSWGDASPFEKLISAVMQGPGFTRAEANQALAAYGVSGPQRISAGLDMLRLYSLLDFDGNRYFFRLAQFPRALRSLEDMESFVRSLVTQTEA